MKRLQRSGMAVPCERPREHVGVCFAYQQERASELAGVAVDVKDASHHLRIGEDLGRWFCCPRPVTAGELGITVHSGQRQRSGDLLWQRVAALQMGL